MANVKISELTGYTDPVATDVLPIVDLANDQTKKVKVEDLLKKFGAGTEALPSFAISGDLDTGIYSPGANQLAISTGGTQRVLIDATGNTTIQGDLTVNGTTTTIESTTLSIDDKNIELGTVSTPSDTTADGGGITLKGATDKTINWVQSTGCWTFNQPMNFNNHVRIDSSGRLGIGTSSPGARLDIGGQIRFVNNTTLDNVITTNLDTSKLRLFGGSAASVNNGATLTLHGVNNAGGNYADLASANGGHIQFRTGTNERMRIDSLGRVGIGTSSPVEEFVVRADAPSIQLESSNASGRNYGFQASNDGKFHAYDATAGVNRITLDSSGNVGIGTTTPGNAEEGAGLQVRRYIDRNRYYSPDGHYAGSFGYTNNTQDKVWIAVDSGYAKLSAVSAGLFLSAFHADAGGSGCGSTIKNLKSDNALTFSTVTTASSVSNPAVETERMRIDSSGRVGIGLTSPDGKLHVESAATTAGWQIRTDSVGLSNESGFYRDASDNYEVVLRNGSGGLSFLKNDGGASTANLSFTVQGSERLRIDSSGRLLIGTTTSRAASNQNNRLQLFGTSQSTSRMAIFRSSNDTGGSGIHLCKSRGTAGNVVVNNGDQVGIIAFNPYDGGDFQRQCANIQAVIDDAPGVDDVPGRLVFSTTADGASSPTERMRIDSSGRVGIGATPGSEEQFIVHGGNSSIYVPIARSNTRWLSLHSGGTHPAIFTNSGSDIRFGHGANRNSFSTERMRLDSSGRLLVGHSSSISNAGIASLQQITGDSAATASLSIRRDANSTSGPLLIFGKSRSGALGNNVSVNNNDNIGSIVFAAADGTDVSSQCAEIKAQIDGTPGSNDTPGRLVFMTASDGSNAPTERCRIDSSGRLLVGTTTDASPFSWGLGAQIGGTSTNAGLSIRRDQNSSGGALLMFSKSRGSLNGNTVVQSGDQIGGIYFQGADGTDVNSTAAQIAAVVDGTPGSNDMPGRLMFSTTKDGSSSPTERMRINSSGDVGIGTNFINRKLHIKDDRVTPASFAVEAVNSSATSGAILFASYHAANNANIKFIQCNADQGSTPEEVFRVNGVGNVQNKNNSYGGISDAKLKENIVDATSQWGDIKGIRVRKYNFIGEQDHTQIGVVAQEVEAISPGLVEDTTDTDDDGNDLGTVTKSVNYSVLYMKAVKALQEAMERIETLEAKVAALEAGN